ncbi:MAG: BCD family MFS transporter [Pseudomonadales bacterium]
MTYRPVSAPSKPQSSGQFGWLDIIRLGLVQTSLGAIVVLTTSTMNRVMVIEHMLPAMLPGALVALHYFIQLSRPRLGFASDVQGRRTPWILLGMLTLAVGGILASVATALMGTHFWLGTALAVIAFSLIGVGVGASGTSLLALLASCVPDQRRAAAGSIVWIMMILGFVLTAGIAGHFLDPFSTLRLVQITTIVALIALTVTALAIYRLEPAPDKQQADKAPAVDFPTALAEVWADAKARQFTIFVFVSMLAYSTQDLILEPFAGAIFGLTPGQSTQLAGIQNGGVLSGMILVAILGTTMAGKLLGSLKFWIVTGCLASAAALALLAIAGQVGPEWPLTPSVFALGIANGCFAVAAIGSMMALAGSGPKGREGVRMGLWGAAQAMAFALGGFFGTALFDLIRALFSSPALAYSSVFIIEAIIFLIAAVLAQRIEQPGADHQVTTQLSANARWRLSS